MNILIIALELLYGISITLCLIVQIKNIRNEILHNDGVVTASFIVYNILSSFIPIINTAMVIKYFDDYLKNTTIKFDVKGIDEKS